MDALEVGTKFNQGSIMNNINKNRKEILFLMKQWQYSHPHALFGKDSSSEIIALHNNWEIQSGSWHKWSPVQFGEICYAQFPSINSRGSDIPDLLPGIL